MLKSGKFDLVHEIFGKMERSGVIPNALTYKGNEMISSMLVFFILLFLYTIAIPYFL